MERIRVGMVGVGGFGGYRRASMRHTEMYQLVACFDYNPDAAAAAAKDDGCEIVDSYDALLARDDIEAIVISTGGTSHAEYGIRAAQAGKHFFVEKPLCCDATEMNALLDAGEQAGVVMGMGHTYPDGPDDALLRAYMAEDKLGDITAIEMTTCHGGGWLSSPWRFVPEKNPGGMLFQCGVHSIYWAEATFGRVAEVMCMMRADVNPNTRTSDATTVLMRHASGLLSTLHTYHVTAYHHYKYIYGTKGNLYIYEHPAEVYYQARNADGKPEQKIRIDAQDMPAGKRHSHMNVRTWAQAIRGEGTPKPSIYDGASAVAVTFAAVESADTGRLVAVPDVRARAGLNV